MILAMLSIGEVATRAGLRTSALRYYERVGLIPAPERASGRRRYRADVLDRLAVIQYAQSTGFTLNEIRRLFDGKPYSQRMRTLAQAKLVELDEAVARAQTMKAFLRGALRCNCLSLEACGRLLRRRGAQMTSSKPGVSAKRSRHPRDRASVIVSRHGGRHRR